jgi:hypothetical protein
MTRAVSAIAGAVESDDYLGLLCFYLSREVNGKIWPKMIPFSEYCNHLTADCIMILAMGFTYTGLFSSCT